MKKFVALAVFLLSSLAAAEDPQLRETAVALLEKANAVSVPAVWPPYESAVTFRYFSSQGVKDGQESLVWLSPRQLRIETRFGDFHLINVFTANRLAVAGENATSTPAPVHRVQKLLPIYLVRFDHEDVIKSITDAPVHGRGARCINFDTAFGDRIDNNEICVDKENGTLLRFRNAGQVTENSEFFQLAGAYLPARIDYFRNGSQVLEIHQQITAIEGAADPNVLLPPPGAEIRTKCRQFRRAFAQQAPQPPVGNGSQTTDLVVSGTIDKAGRLQDTVVQLTDRPDLQQEALQTAAKWLFTPAMCDGKPTLQEASIVLHFQGR